MDLFILMCFIKLIYSLLMLFIHKFMWIIADCFFLLWL